MNEPLAVVKHTCTPEEVPSINCPGCMWRGLMDLLPITPERRLADLAADEAPTYAAFGVVTREGYGSSVWLAICSWCGAVVTASEISEQPMSSTAHTEWHRRTGTR